jgi:hypothetical protein
MDIKDIGSEQGPVAGCCEYGDKSSDAGATELVSYLVGRLQRNEYVQSCLLGYTAVKNYCRPTFQRCVLPPSSVPLKRRSTITLHGSISQKTTLNIIFAAVRT